MDTDADLQHPSEDVVAAVLALVVQRCSSISRDCRTLCALTQVSTACRAALQQCTAACEVTLRGPTELAASCGAWLAHFPGFAKTLQYQHTGPGAQEAYRLLGTALRAAAGLQTVPALPALPAPGTAAVSPAPSGLLHLTSCVVDLPGGLSDAPALGPALACATALQHLSVGSGRRAGSIGHALAHLTRLTSLKVDAVVDSACVSTLPASLRELALAVDVEAALAEYVAEASAGANLQGTPGKASGSSSSSSSGGSGAATLLFLEHLSALRTLHLHVCCGSSRLGRGRDGWAYRERGAFVVLPRQLRELHAAGAVRGFVFETEDGLGQMMESCALSASCLHPVVVSGLLCRTPQLRSLTVAAQLDLPAYEPSFQDVNFVHLGGVALILAAAPACLTSLAVLGYRPDQVAAGPVPFVAAALAKFEELRDLRWCLGVNASYLEPFDMLTRLHLYRSGFTDAEFEQLCDEELPNSLVDLEVSGSQMQNCEVVFQAVSQLRDLERLSLGGNQLLQPTEEDLLHLVPPDVGLNLSWLTYLCLPASRSLTPEVLAAFAADMPSLRELTVA